MPDADFPDAASSQADGYASPMSAIDVRRTPLGSDPFTLDPNDGGLGVDQVFHHLVLGAEPEDFHPAVQPTAQSLGVLFQPRPKLGPGLLGSYDTIQGIAARTSGLSDAGGGPAYEGDGTTAQEALFASAGDRDVSVFDPEFAPSHGDAVSVNPATAVPVKRAFVNPWGRTVPVYPNVKDFVIKNWPAAERLATQLPGVTPEQILTALGAENSYGADAKASRYGNYGGIHYDPSKGYFPGQTGVFNTKGVVDPNSGKVVGVQPMAQFPTDKGFELSGQVLVNRIKPFIPSGGLIDSKQFFNLAHAHGWGKTNPQYLDTIYGRQGSYWLVKAAAEDRKGQ